MKQLSEGTHEEVSTCMARYRLRVGDELNLFKVLFATDFSRYLHRTGSSYIIIPEEGIWLDLCQLSISS